MHVLGPVAAYHPLTTPGRHRRPRRLGAIFTVRPPTATHAFMKLTARPHLPTPRALQQQAVYQSHERKLNQSSNMVKLRVYATNAASMLPTHTLYGQARILFWGGQARGALEIIAAAPIAPRPAPERVLRRGKSAGACCACRSKTAANSYTYARLKISERPAHGPVTHMSQPASQPAPHSQPARHATQPYPGPTRQPARHTPASPSQPARHTASQAHSPITLLNVSTRDIHA